MNQTMVTKCNLRWLAVLVLLALGMAGPVCANRLDIYPTADIWAGKTGYNTTYSDMVTGSGNNWGNAASASAPYLVTISSTESGKFNDSARPIWIFNTVGLGANGTVTITNVTMRVPVYGKGNGLGSPALVLMNGTVNVFTGPTYADYQHRGNTELSPRIAYADVTTTADMQVPFTATGISLINKSGYTVIFGAFSWDADGTFGGSWGASKNAYFNVRMSEYATVDNRPKLTILYDIVVTPGANFTANQTNGPQPLTVKFTDESTNSPTAWNWSCGDGTYSEEQNPEHTYSSTGLFNVQLTASNLDGSDVELKPGYISTYTYPGPMGKLLNAVTNLSISTYDGSGQQTHPSVIYSAAGWNGYHYLMAMTPYPGGSDIYENPSMRYSNNKITWVKIAGQPDPIVSPATGYFSDPCIVLDGSTLYLFYRHTDGTDYYNYTTTTDGITWTAPIQTNLDNRLSASFVKNISGGWEAWAHLNADPYTLKHYYGTSPAAWAEYGTVTGATISGKTIWHSEVKIHDNQYQMLMVPYDWTGLYYYNSTNGLTWIPSESNPVLTGNATSWDPVLYRSSFIESDDGHFDVWYTGFNSTAPRVWHIGYTEYPQLPPVAAFTGTPTSGTAPLTVQFTDENTNTPTSWNWSFGEGNYSESQSPSHIYEFPGTFTVNLTATNAAGSNTTSKADYITVLAPIPTTAFSCTPTVLMAHNSTTCTDASYPWITAWLWDFGDGNTSVEQNPTHQYDFVGLFNISLRATNSNTSVWENKTGYINVTLAPVPPVPTPITASFRANITCGNIPVSVQFTDLSTGNPESWNWSFGEGNYSEDQNPVFTYENTGLYDVSLYVNNTVEGSWSNRTDYIQAAPDWYVCNAGHNYTVEDVPLPPELCILSLTIASVIFIIRRKGLL